MPIDKHELLVGALLEYVNELEERQYLGIYNITEELADLYEAIELADLTEKQREALTLVYFSNMRQTDASKVMRCRQDVISRHLTAAKRKIANVYKQWEEYENDIT